MVTKEERRKADMPTHSESRRLPYSPDQMYALVADVAHYPQFIPWISASRVRSVTPEGDHKVMLADLVIGFKMFRERFLSRVALWDQIRRIDTEYVDGPFKHMISRWEFTPAPDGEAGCEVHFAVDFEFKNKILQGAAGLFFHEAMQRIVRAFEARAEALYGKAAASSATA
jgi:coenzyme Q-binding protein COQ10